MGHGQFLPCVRNIGVVAVEGSLLHQPLQDSITVREVFCSLLHTTSRLHPSEEDKVALVEVLSFITIPIIGWTVDLVHHQGRGSIRRGMVARGQTRTGVISVRHTSNRTLLEIATNKVLVAFVGRHEEGMRSSTAYNSHFLLSTHAAIGLVPVTHSEVRFYRPQTLYQWYDLSVSLLSLDLHFTCVLFLFEYYHSFSHDKFPLCVGVL